MDNDKLDEYERVMRNNGRGGLQAVMVGISDLRALITAARRPAILDREAVAKAYSDGFAHGCGSGCGCSDGQTADPEDVREYLDEIVEGRTREIREANAEARRRGDLQKMQTGPLPDREAVARVIDFLAFYPQGPGGTADWLERRQAAKERALSKADAILALFALSPAPAPKVTLPQNEWMGLAPSTTHNITIPEFPKVTT